ncbi:DUF6221 family protein [Streptomyces sp. NPDC001652]|uniref:DUF6221 family protein n=1 Tax=Streptomyces sp. NPDC001652 TaxID=3154393 RepID=UPI003322B911
MSEIADFLRARYRERRTVIEAMPRGPWTWAKAEGGTDTYECLSGPDGEVLSSGDAEGYRSWIDKHDALDGFLAVVQPEELLADLDAKLALVDELEPEEEAREPETDAQLHARFAHPAWEYRVTEGPRKQWDDIDVPPTDDNGDPEPGWERNIDAGRDGWERWDYTEESYWRRLRPDGPRPEVIPRPLRILAQPFAGQPGHKGEEWAP